MSEYVIVTDSAADLSQELVQEMGVEVLPLSFVVGEQTYHNYPDNREMDPKAFYRHLREGGMATTSAVNVSQYTACLEPLLQAGKDVLILAFSSGLSTTYQSSAIAVNDLKEQYPDRKIYTVDTLCASLGQGLLVWHAVRRQKMGATIEEVRDWAEANKLHLCHWFTVDDLHFLKRGGRVSAATAVVGTMLAIKPVLHVDNEGHLINMAKARGRSGSLKALVDHMAQTVTRPEEQVVFISHGDCLEDAHKVGEMVQQRLGVRQVVYNTIGPVIGAHAGPGTVALFFLGTER
ncbi:DegV family protein [Pseudoflavonifractor phocaeensis]|uniref:DegV family protein n=1 Tax=Pseudoflavonifractor phocaeensis TaxID=1870988 RepID=UPI00195D9946|nr:DegV family protein [Pseudoflavonifractor phocaeensis]MBM6870711.1 DegV family protein [Pseudoflavonifractor phocaeensis]MBM6939260.1 DegV family protein [Pseudoflavonifractor phocaeensis]